MKSLTIILVLLVSASCVNQKWARYDASQYEVAMLPGEESYQKHVDLLAKWSESKEGLPPGVAADLAFHLALLGRTAEAEALFEAETQLYPKSARFIDALRAITFGPPEADTPEPPPETPTDPEEAAE